MFKKIINRIILYRIGNRINVTKTIILNFMLFPVRIAIHFPVLVYGECTLGPIRGRGEINGTIRRGLLKIGYTHPVKSCHSKSYVEIEGTILIGGRNHLRRGVHLQIAKTGQFSMGWGTTIGVNTSIICFDKIQIGKATSIGNDTTIMDSDFHYVVNLETGEIRNKVKEIKLGDNCWIGANCTIKKGAKLPNGTIVAGPYSMVGKDYTLIIDEYCVIGGSPAKFIKSGMRRINNQSVDDEIYKYMRNHGVNQYQVPSKTDYEKLCMPY